MAIHNQLEVGQVSTIKINDIKNPRLRAQVEAQLIAESEEYIPGRGKKAPRSSEHKEQRKVFEWKERNIHRYPILSTLFAVPNGAPKSSRIAGHRMKKEGQVSGVCDIHLPVPVGGYSGLWIEMKYGYAKPRKEQEEWMDLMRWAGHYVDVCYSANQAIVVIINYITQAKAESK